MRSAASVRSRAIRAASTACCAAISASWIVRTCCDLQRAGALVGGDALGIDGHGLGDARLLGRLAGRDLGLLDRAGALDLAPARLFLVGDARVGHDASCWMRAFSTASRAAISASSTVRVRSISRWRTSRSEAMRAVSTARWLAMRAFSISSRASSLLLLDRARALDLALAGLALGGDAGLGDRLLVGDARLLDRLARGDLRLLGLGLAQRALARHFGALQRAAHLDVALLFQPRGLAFALDVERLPLGFEIAGADLDHRVLLDVVAQLAPGLDVLHQPGQAFGVEAVRRVEEFQVGLVEIGDRDRFQFEAVLRQRLGRGRLDARDIFAALLVHLLHRHLGGDRADRGDELAGQQRVQLLRLQRAAAERRGGDRDRFPRRPARGRRNRPRCRRACGRG